MTELRYPLAANTPFTEATELTDVLLDLATMSRAHILNLIVFASPSVQIPSLTLQ